MKLNFRQFIFICLYLPILSVGCTTQPREVNWPEARALGEGLPAYRAPRSPDAIDLDRELTEPTRELSLRDAFAAALLNNPTLKTFGWEVRIREARALQAGLPPNPEVELEVEEFGGTGGTAGFDGAETTLLFSQLIELGWKRARRTRVAELDQDLAAWDYEAARVAVLADVARNFIATLALQERLRLARRNLELAQETFDAIRKRVEAGAVSPLEQTRSGVVVARARIEAQRVRRELDAARLGLAALWGGLEPRFDRVVGDFGQLKPLPTIESLAAVVQRNPELARWSVEIAQRRARVDLERSLGVPDLNAGVGVRYLSEPSDTAAVVQFSLPLPLINRNQGGVLAARYELAKAAHSKRAAELRISTAFGQAYQRLLAAHEAVAALEREVLPASQEAYESTATAYKEGKVGYLELLDAQRTLFEAQSQLVQLLGEYHGAVVDVESLVGQPLSRVKDVRSDPSPATTNDLNKGATP